MPPRRKNRPENEEERAEAEEDEHLQTLDIGDAAEEEDLLNMKIPPKPESFLAKKTSERTIISHIEVENFKSYFGRQIIGPFHKSFTSIIGPNGSGKSNVIDALLFVFGYRASKIRSKKVSVLIHSSAGRDNIDSCTVVVHFYKIIDKVDGTFKKVQDSDITFSRTAHKNNSSKYTLNGRTVTFKEVTQLLLANGIDLVHNRFLILQGEVEQISMMKPKAEKEEEEGMLEYLEDIIGSSRLKTPIVKLHNRIERINSKRAIQLQRLNHAEKEKLEIDGPFREVLAQMRLANAITCVKNRIMAVRRLSVEDRIAQLKQEKEAMDAELNEAQEKLTELLKQTKQQSKERQHLQNQLDKCHEAVQALEREIAEQKQNKTKADNETKRLQNRHEKLQTEIASEENKLEELQKAPEKSKKKIEEYRKLIIESQEIIEKNMPILMKKLEEVQGLIGKEQKQKAELEARLSGLSAQEDQLNSKLTLAQEKMLNLQREEADQRRKYDELSRKLLDSEELLTKRQRELPAAEETLIELEGTVDGKKSRLSELRDRERRLVDRVRELRQKCEEIKQTEEQFSSKNALLNRLMEAKRNGEITGILGRLGDLGAIDQRYDVAISTTCAALDYVVVEDVQTGQNCIELLKRENLGIASFIALDKQQQFWPYIRQTPQTPENAQRLFDLIRVADEKVLPAFYFALQDTLIANDIFTAKRIAMDYGRRWRTVTLKGEVVEVSGAMTGGGISQTRGRIGADVRVDTSQRRESGQESLAQLQQELANVEAEMNNIRRECAQLDYDVRNKGGEELRRIKETVRNAKIEIETSTTNIAVLRKQLEAQKAKVINATADPEQVRLGEEEVNALKSQSDKLAEKTDALRNELMTINERIDEITERIAGPYERQKKEAEEKWKSSEKGINTENANVAASERNVTKAKKKLRDLAQDIKEIEKKVESVHLRCNKTEERLDELEEQLGGRKEQLGAAKEHLDEFMSSVGDRNNEEVELQKKVEQLRREAKQFGIYLANDEAELRDIATKLSKLKLFRLKKLTETFVKQVGTKKRIRSEKEVVNKSRRQLNDDDEEEDEDDIEEENGHTAVMMDRRSGTHQQAMFDDGLDKYLQDCERLEEQSQQQQEEEEDELGEREDGNGFMEMEEDDQDQLYMPIPTLDEGMLRSGAFDDEQLIRELGNLEKRKGIGEINVTLVQEYKEKLRRYHTELNAFNLITRQRDLHRALHDRLKKQRLYEFMDGFQQIAVQLRTTYQMITIQGDISLELVDSLDPFSEGIGFNVRPPKKSWKQISNLSGGEKTLASLALVFGLHHYKPTPVYVMDEIDAALDFRNVSIIGNYLQERTRNAQFIVISLRNQMYEKADRMVGIFKVNDCTRNVVVDSNTLEQLYKQKKRTLPKKTQP